MNTSGPPPNLPHVIACPACRRVQGTPAHGRTFECMFCGERIDPLRAQAPTSSLTLSGKKSPAIRSASQPVVPTLTAPISGLASDRGIENQGGSGYAYDPGATQIAVYRWWNPLEALSALVSLVYSAVIAVIFLMPFLTGDDAPGLTALIATLVVGVSAFSALYRSLAFFINRTTLHLVDGESGKDGIASRDTLKVSHRPLPWSGSGQRIPMAELVRVKAGSPGGKRSRKVALLAERKVGGPLTLIPSMRSLEVAEDLAAMVNARLNLNRGV